MNAGTRVGTGIWAAAAIGLVAAILAVPAAAKPGDVIVGDADAEQVLRLKPNGNISLISDDDRLDSPNDSVFGSNGKLYVADYDAFDPAGAVFSINPKTGKTKVLAKEDPLRPARRHRPGAEWRSLCHRYRRECPLSRRAARGRCRAGLGRRRPRRLGRRGRSA